jgi:hypothetical protein
VRWARIKADGASVKESLPNSLTRHPGIAKRYPGPGDFAFSVRESHWVPAFAGMTKKIEGFRMLQARMKSDCAFHKADFYRF